MTTHRMQAAYDRIAEEFARVTADMPPVLITAAKHFISITEPGAPIDRFFARYRAEEVTALLVEGGFALRDHTANSARAHHWSNFMVTATK